MEDSRAEAKVEASKPVAASSGSQEPKSDIPDLSTSSLAVLQSDVQPVGHDYVEEVSLNKLGHTWEQCRNSNLECNVLLSFPGPQR